MSLLVKTYPQKTKVNVTDRPVQSPELNPTENGWSFRHSPKKNEQTKVCSGDAFETG